MTLGTTAASWDVQPDPSAMSLWESQSQTRRALCCGSVLLTAAIVGIEQGMSTDTWSAEEAILGFCVLVLALSSQLRNTKLICALVLILGVGLYVVSCISVMVFLVQGDTFFYGLGLSQLHPEESFHTIVAKTVSMPLAMTAGAMLSGFSFVEVLPCGVVMTFAATALFVTSTHTRSWSSLNSETLPFHVFVPMALLFGLSQQQNKQQQKLAKALAEERNAASNQQHVVGCIFHEVRNPISNIMLACELVLNLLTTTTTTTTTTTNLSPSPTPPSPPSPSPPSPTPPSPTLPLSTPSLSSPATVDFSVFMESPSHNNKHSQVSAHSQRCGVNDPKHLDVDEIRELVGDIRQSTEAAVRVLNDALNLQKLTTGTFEFVQKPFLLSDLVTFTLRMVKPQLRAKKIQIKQRVDPQLKGIYVAGDFHRLQQVLLNYLTNAYKFTPTNGVVEVRATQIQHTTIHNSTTTASTSTLGAHPCSTNSSHFADHNSSSNSTTNIMSQHPTEFSDHIKSDPDLIRVRFSVYNTGHGINEEDKTKIFQPWSQIRAGEQQQGQGSGLGLALCKAFVEKGHGGRVWFESEVGSHTEFFFEIEFQLASPEFLDSQHQNSSGNNLNEGKITEQGNNVTALHNPTQPVPLLRPLDAALSRNVTPLELQFIAGMGPQVDVLIVEDSHMSRTLLAKTLKLLGVSYAECCDGQEAVDKLRAHGIEFCNVIFMDKEMPNLDGYGATSQIREMGFTGPIVGCTGNALDSQVAEFLKAGATQVLAKPVTQNTLKCTLQQFGLLPLSPTVSSRSTGTSRSFSNLQ